MFRNVNYGRSQANEMQCFDLYYPTRLLDDGKRYLLNYSSIDHTPSLNKVVSKWTCNPYLMPEYDVVIFRHDEGDGER